MKKHRWFQYTLLGLCISFLLVACKKTPNPAISPLASPLISQSPLLTPASTEIPIAPFVLNRPVKLGEQRVTGSGPAHTPIALLDVTMGGNILAFTTIDKEGYFVFEVDAPLEAKHRLGIAIADLTGTGKRIEDFYDERYYGEEPRQVPQVGFFFDTVMVTD